MENEKVAAGKSKYELAKEAMWKVCAAGYNCWLRCGLDYCAICGKGDEKAWRKKCDLGRKAMGMPSYAELIEMASKAFKAEAGK